MKNLIMCIFTMLLGISCMAIVSSISGRNARNMELLTNVDHAVESTVAGAAEQKEAVTREAFLADFMQDLCSTLKSDSDVVVNVWQADEEKGLLGVEVEEMFRYPNGKQGRVKSNRIAILNQKKEVIEENHSVKFYLSKSDMQADKNCYKTYVVAEGEKISEPIKPVQNGKSFHGWSDANDYAADFSQMVEEDITYYGEWR